MNDINKNVISTVNRQLYPYHRLDDIKAVKLQAGYTVLAVLCNKYDTSNVCSINIYANLLDMKVYLEAEMDFWSLNEEEINAFSDLLLLFVYRLGKELVSLCKNKLIQLRKIS